MVDACLVLVSHTAVHVLGLGGSDMRLTAPSPWWVVIVEIGSWLGSSPSMVFAGFLHLVLALSH